MPWSEAIHQPGAGQMQFAKRLLQSRPYLTRIPDDGLIIPEDPPTSVPGAGLRRFVATRDSDGTYAMVYAPVGRAFRVRLDHLNADKLKAWWFDPRTGKVTSAGEFPGGGERAFLSPDPGEERDWVLVLDDAAKGYPTPGRVTRSRIDR
jgi:hypothetical protein